MIVMGNAVNGNLLKAAAEAHLKAIGSIDARGVTSAADYQAVNSALGRSVASVPTSKVMYVYNAWAGILKARCEFENWWRETPTRKLGLRGETPMPAN